jgi:uncharacterized protein YbbC (DUF1343 family)
VRLAASILVFATSAVFFSPSPPTVTPGLDVLRESGGERLRGRSIGLITNHTGKTIDGVPAAEVFRELGLPLRALYSPEHGLDGRVAAGEKVGSSELENGLPVFSLYGKTRKPTAEMLEGIDTLVFDVQDVGVRFYTYISTLKLAMEAAADADIEMVVLDRPNPNTGVRVEGPVLEMRHASFVGIAPIALVHGMTVGELANLFNGEGLLAEGKRVRLRVVRARGWKREMSWDETGLPWRPTSPNIRSMATAIAYPAMGLFEGINVSDGRGTRETFLLAGAPWIDSSRLVEELNRTGLPGVDFFPESFEPRVIPEAPHPIYPDETCHGFRLRIGDPVRFQAVRTGLSAIATLRELYPQQFQWESRAGVYWIDLLLGSTVPRERLEAGDSVTEILATLEPEVERFREMRARYLVYE